MVSDPPSLTSSTIYSFTLLNAIYDANHAPILMPVGHIIRGRCHGEDTPKAGGRRTGGTRCGEITGDNSLLLEGKGNMRSQFLAASSPISNRFSLTGRFSGCACTGSRILHQRTHLQTFRHQIQRISTDLSLPVPPMAPGASIGVHRVPPCGASGSRIPPGHIPRG